METLELLGVALGMATLAGINLYLTVFLSGLAIRFDWIHLLDKYSALEILAHPAIITIAGLLYFVEFFADKIPWLDSAWDSAHTLLRPVGGTLLAIQALGESNPAFSVIVAMLAGGMSLVSHGMKATTRLVVNSSPEPFSNIAVSVAEDVGVVAGLWLIYLDPVIALIVAVVFVAASAWFAPRIFAAVWLKLWLAWRKLNQPPADEMVTALSTTLPVNEMLALERLQRTAGPIAWTAHCIAGKGAGLPSGRKGYLVATDGAASELYFVRGKGWRATSKLLDLTGYRVANESKFLTENLVFYKDKSRITFLFDRPSAGIVDSIVRDLQHRLQSEVQQPEPATAA